MHYDEYKPTEEEVEKRKEEIKQKRLDKLRDTKNSKKNKRPYQKSVTNVPTDTRPVVGTRFQ